jgi:hypothetical protein
VGSEREGKRVEFMFSQAMALLELKKGISKGG